MTRVAVGQLSTVAELQSVWAVSSVLKQTLTLLVVSPKVAADAIATAFTRVVSWSTIAVRLACPGRR